MDNDKKLQEIPKSSLIYLHMPSILVTALVSNERFWLKLVASWNWKGINNKALVINKVKISKVAAVSHHF